MAQRILAILLLLLTFPLLIILFLLVKLTSKGPFLFKQRRAGKHKTPFMIYKIRTMRHMAERLQSKYIHINEADGPVFKIRNDPRYTAIGKLLSHTGLDELPQLINIIKGEMVFVGPRPLPISEAKKVPNKYKGRFLVLPGITSPWVINGSHHLPFNKWMELDVEYAKNRTFRYDIIIAVKTIILIFRSFFKVL